jgi:hypothetical protein
MIATPTQAFEVLANSAPAALTTHADDQKVSDRYCFVPSTSLVEAAYGSGLVLNRATQINPKRGEKRGETAFSTHELEFIRPQDVSSFNAGVTPRVTIINGHAANTSVKIFAGIYRAICSNGLVIGAQQGFEQTRVRHVGHIDIGDLAEQIQGQTERAVQGVDISAKWSEIELTGDRLEQVTKKLVAAGASARWGSWKDAPQAEQRCARDFTQPVRYGDNENNLWAVYNRAQESFIKGVCRRSSLTGHWNRKIRPVNDLHLKSKVNQALWTAAEEAYLAG